MEFKPELVCKVVEVESGDRSSVVLGNMDIPVDKRSYEWILDELCDRSNYNFYEARFIDRDGVWGYYADWSNERNYPNVPSFRLDCDGVEYDIDLVYAVEMSGYYFELPYVQGIEN